jgi:hypothetical protein
MIPEVAKCNKTGVLTFMYVVTLLETFLLVAFALPKQNRTTGFVFLERYSTRVFFHSKKNMVVERKNSGHAWKILSMHGYCKDMVWRCQHFSQRQHEGQGSLRDDMHIDGFLFVLKRSRHPMFFASTIECCSRDPFGSNCSVATW